MNPNHNHIHTLTLTTALTLLTTPHLQADKTKLDQDRAAIRAMAGNYKIQFHFQETHAYNPNYQLKKPYTADATELIKIITDKPHHITLQHLLLTHDENDQPQIIKHWRQEWRYQDRQILQYRGRNTWQNQRLTRSQTRDTWTQAVFQVDDGPRYESHGKWQHIGDTSTWESHTTWRPLPRRERRRTDYHVLIVRNRHTITPQGWIHQQDNLKTALDQNNQPQTIIAHETGLNQYQRAHNLDLQAAHQYWQTTAPFWQKTRQTWQTILDQKKPIHITHRANQKNRWNQLLTLAKTNPNTTLQQIQQTLQPYINPTTQ